MHHIFLDPDGTQDFGLLVIVQEPTGVTYDHQCAGYSNDLRRTEGFLVPVGNTEQRDLISQWFWMRFRGASPINWNVDLIFELSELVREIPFWVTPADDGMDQRGFLELDQERVSDCVEGWVPVKTGSGKGILVFRNSD